VPPRITGPKALTDSASATPAPPAVSAAVEPAKRPDRPRRIERAPQESPSPLAQAVEQAPAGEPHQAAQPGARGGDANDRYRRLPTGAHGLAREEVERDQRGRLQRAMMELIGERGYQAVRILDLTQLAHVSRPTFYELYADKEELLISAYNDIAARTARTVLTAFDVEGDLQVRLRASMHAFGKLAAAEPQAMSLFLLGAFGAGPKALGRRKETVAALEHAILSSRDGTPDPGKGDLMVTVQLGGIREVAVARLHQGRTGELEDIADELIEWVTCYGPKLPRGLECPPPIPPEERAPEDFSSERARRAHGRLPSGRHDLPREVVVNSQRERIIDATAEIVAEKGLAGLTIPEIASRANVSHETFYEMFPTKRDAFIGAQRTGMFQALTGGVEAWEAQMPDWPRAIAAGLRGVVDYLISEPALAHLTIVDAFGASPETIATRDEIMRAFATYFEAGFEHAPEGHSAPRISGEAVVGGVWQVLHHYIDNGRVAELSAAVPQLTYMLLAPWLGPKEAKRVALRAVEESEPAAQAAG
jgi:AcrR family transcriptional regulator